MLSDASELLRAARTLDMHAFGEAAFEWLKPHIAFWGGGLITSSAKTPSLVDAHYHKTPAECVAEWTQYAHLDLMANDFLARPGEAVIHRLDDPRYANPIYAPLHRMLQRHGLTYTLGIAVPQAGDSIASVLAISRDGVADECFKEAERKCFQQCALVIIEAWTINRILRAGAIVPLAELDSPMALVANDGWVRYATAKWTRIVFGSIEQVQVPRVPAPLCDAPLGKEIEWRRGTWYATREAADDGYVIRLRPRRASDALGRREREVAQLYASGLSYKEVAQSLKLSPNTVRNHIQNAFRKLEASNRHALARHLDIRA